MSSPDSETKSGTMLREVDHEAETTYVRKVDFILLPLLCLSNLANAKTDGLEKDLHFKNNDYSLIVLLFYIPFGLCDLPWNLLLKRYSGRIMLSFMTVVWGILALCQCAAKSFGGMLAIRIILGVFEAGFFAGATFYFTLFYTRGEMGFRLAIMQSFAVLASAFSGLISFGVFQINEPAVKGWQWLFIIEGAMTLLCGLVGFWWLPDGPSTAWFLTERERAAATARLLRDTSSEVDTGLNIKECFQSWNDWKFPVWCLITFTYPVAYATAMNFFPLIVQRLGYSAVKTNLWTVAPNMVGAVVLLAVAKSSDHFRERTFHISSRAANTGFFVGLGNLAGIMSAATFRTEYAPQYIPTLVATCCCNGVCIVFTIGLGLWMRGENRRRDREQGVRLRGEDVDTRYLDIRHPCLISKVGQRAAYLFGSSGRSDVRGRLHPTLTLLEMKNHVCQWPNCRKSFTRAEHLRRHSLNHEQSRDGYTCERCFVHFNRPDLLYEEAGGPGMGVLETRKRTRRAGDGTIITRPRKRQCQPDCSESTTASSVSVTSGPDLAQISLDLNGQTPHGAPVSPPGSASDQPSLCLDDHDPLLAPMMPGGPFEPFVEPIPGQFDAADGAWSVGMDGSSDFFSVDTATDFNMPFAATHNYNWLFDVASLDDAFHHLDLPLGSDMMAFADGFDTGRSPMLPVAGRLPDNDRNDRDSSSMLLEAASFIDRGASQGQPSLQDSGDLPDLVELDWMSGPSTFDNNTSLYLPRLSEDARQRVLKLIAQAPPLGATGHITAVDSPLLSLAALQNYSDLFFTRFNTTYPLIHQPTFMAAHADSILLAAILSMGATYGTREAHQLAVGIHDNLRNQLFCHADFSPQPPLWVLQSMLLVDCFGKMRAGHKQRERAQLFHCVLIKLIRRSDCCGIRTHSAATSLQDSLDGQWRRAMDAEQRKRLAMHCFMWDTQHAVLFSQSLCMSAFEIRSSLPCGANAWEASSAEEWARHASREADHLFLSVLKGYITPGTISRPRDLNALARIVVLHGLMSISADLKRRDQTTLQSEIPERVGAWTPRMGRSYDLWKVDFDADCLAMKLGQPADPRRFTGLKTSAYALFRAAHLALNVEILDLQIAAGASQILGRAVTADDRERSRRNLPRWLQSDPAIVASRHAATLLQEAVLSLHDWDQTDAFHFPWCLYLATLACWAFHRGLDRCPPQGRLTTDLSSLIVAMTTCSTLAELGGLGGKYDPTPLVVAMAQQLATVRWAVVHDAMKVLVNLST
ncbi:MFS general substrate transporter [Aspergillus taichungensis]|uniref:MFS general substrate transporter n=1 Tax=Aspergillus taichungensis TaxID=482145 RepID=A0A2J5I6S0_9EURO|nr:MFS general substrate transporter [Aspergillus taichungensis]